MSRKWIGVVVAIVLAAVGTWVLVRYVQSADDRALQGEETVSVLVVDASIPAGSAAADLVDEVHVELVPVKVQAPGSVASLDELGDKVAAIDLVPGEQVISSRFVAVETFDKLEEIEIPEGFLEITLSLSPERSLGGDLRRGDQVAVFASFDPFDLEEATTGAAVDEQSEDPDAEPSAEEGDPNATQPSQKTPNTTHIIVNGVIVTNVQVEELPQENTSDDGATASLEFSPTGNLLITLAMQAPDAERFVFTAEFGRVWLAETFGDLDVSDTSIQDRSTVYEAPLIGADG
jgi:pilus assembly protein CpaB